MDCVSYGYEALKSVTDVNIPVMPNSIVTAIALILSTLSLDKEYIYFYRLCLTKSRILRIPDFVSYTAVDILYFIHYNT